MFPRVPSLYSLPIEYLGKTLLEKLLEGVYCPGPGDCLYEGALSGLLADMDLFYPSWPRILLCS